MTDPLTGKELVEKSFEYVDRLTRECSKVLLEDYNKTHRKLAPSKVPIEVGTDIARWFEKRDKNVRLSVEPNSSTQPQPNQYGIKFKGNTKDADFELSSSVTTFVAPGSEYTGNPISFVKSITIIADKTKFARRKP